MDLSKLFTLNWNDVWQSLKTALFTGILGWLTALLTPIWDTITAGQIPTFAFDWKQVLIGLGVAVISALGSVLKRYVSNSEGKISADIKK